MPKKIDLIGQVFGRLTVLEDVGRGGGGVLWKCLCDCGNTVEVKSYSLQSSVTKSCGCLHKERASETSKIDLTGRIFGRLTVLEDVGRTKRQQVIWRCLCECGNFVDVISSNLQRGHTQSCGCYNKERASETQYKNLVGQKLGRLTVLEDVGRTKHGGVIWKCLCECGNIVEVVAGNLQSGTTKSCGCYNRARNLEIHSGKNSHFWRGGITPLRQIVRCSIHYKEWRTSVFQRDFYICQHCHQVGKYLHAHHIIRFSKIMEEHNITTLEEALQCEALWDTNNGLTLCKKCHKREHVRLRALTQGNSCSILQQQ